jgi:hypothetical protein
LGERAGEIERRDGLSFARPRAGDGEDTRATAREVFYALTQNPVLVCRRGIGGSEAD